MDASYLSKNPFIKYIISLDKDITLNLISADIQTRPAKSNGIWCCILLPIILNVYSIQYEVSPLYRLVAFISVGLLIYSILFIVFLSISCLVLQEQIYGGCIASSFFSILLMYTFLGHDLSFCAYFSVCSVSLYSWLLRKAIVDYPKTFTIGEAMVVVQGIVLFLTVVAAKLTSDLDDDDDEMDFIYIIIYTALATVMAIIGVLSLLTGHQKSFKSLVTVVVSCVIMGLLILHSILGSNFVYDIFDFLFVQNNRAQLFLFWLILVALAIFAITLRTQVAVKASTVTRKSFHVLASLVFLSGILFDVDLMLLAAGVVFALCILIEALRLVKIDPVSSSLQSAFQVYSDEKDCGCFAMTPIYLYVGLACPLALVPEHAGAELELLSGVLALGVGDTAASWFGAKYGFNKWAGGNRTYEGTAFNILSQIATAYTLTLFELLPTKHALQRTALAATVAGLVEAKTNQVDNLILPLVTIVALQATAFMNSIKV